MARWLNCKRRKRDKTRSEASSEEKGLGGEKMKQRRSSELKVDENEEEKAMKEQKN